MSNLEKNFTIKKTYLELVPRPTLEEKKALKESIQIHGQREPIIINKDGIILDGHTRFEICSEYGIPIKYRVENFETETLEKSYVIEANLKRRHLTDFQKIELSYSLYLDMVSERKDVSKSNLRSSSLKLESKGRSDVNLGRYIGVSRHLVSMGIYLLKNANEQTKKMLRNGTIPITRAYDSYHPKKLKSRKNCKYLSKASEVQCPFCEKCFPRKDLILK